MKALLLFMIALIYGCNSQEPKLSSLQGASSTSTVPQILYVAKLSTDGDYTTGTIDFEVKFTQVVHALGTPSITIFTDAGPFPATYRSGSGTDTFIFKLNVTAAIIDNDGISVHSPVHLNGGSIYDIVKDEDAILSFAIPDTAGITVNKTTLIPDGTSPSILSIDLEIPTKYSYKTSDANPALIVTFDENVTINLGSMDPYIDLNIGGTSIKAEFNGYVPGFLNKLKFLIVTDPSTPIDLDGVAFGDDLELADTLIKDASGMIINTDITLAPKPRFFIIPETLRDWYDANDEITTGASFVQAYSKSSSAIMTEYGGVFINSTSPKTFQFGDGTSLVGDSDFRVYKVLIVYRISTDPTGMTLMAPYNYTSSGGCYTDYNSNVLCPSGGAMSGAAMIPDQIAVPTVDFGVSFSSGKFRLGPDCVPGMNGCAWFNPTDVLVGDRLDDSMDGNGELDNPTYDFTAGFRYSIVTFSGVSFRPMLGDKGFNQEIAEIFFFNDGFSTAAGSPDLTAIQVYLNAKYPGLQLQ